MANNDQRVLDLLKQAQDKKSAIGDSERAAPRTNNSFSYNPTSSTIERININQVASIDILVNILAFLIGKERDFKEAAIQLGIKIEFDWQGFSLSDWKYDIAFRVNKIRNTEEKKKLDSLEKKLQGLVSDEKRTELELDDIAKMLVS